MPTARILGKPEMFVDVGSTINITCVVENAPGNVRWMHKEKVCRWWAYFYSGGPQSRPLVVVLMCGFSNTAEVSFCRVPTSLSSLGLIRRRLSSLARPSLFTFPYSLFCGGPNGMAGKRPRTHSSLVSTCSSNLLLAYFFIFAFQFQGIYPSRWIDF